MIPPALNTDLGGAVSDFIEAFFQHMADEKTELTFGFSELMAKDTPDIIQATFNRMNP